MVTAPPPGGAMEASTSTVAAAPTAPDADKPMIVVAPPSEAEDMLWRSPDLAYEDQVRVALIGAMLDWGALLPLGPDEWLTVAARDNAPTDSFVPGDQMTLVLRLKGSDIAAFRAGNLTLEQVRARVQAGEF